MPNTDLQGKTIGLLVRPGGNRADRAHRAVGGRRAGGRHPRLVSTQSGRLQAFNHLDKADTFQVDTTVEVSDHTEFDGLLLPGGVANPDYLRTQPKAVEFAKSFFDAGKPVAVICHAGWTLVEADVVRGRTMTSYPSIRTDLRNAGATWVDEEVRICEDGPNTLVSSRSPKDLKAFCAAAVEAFAG